MTQHTILLTDQDLMILNEALINLPFKIVAPLIERIGQQLKSNDISEDV